MFIFFFFLSTASIFVVGRFSYEKTKKALISRTFDQLISVRTEKEKRLNDFFKQCKNDLCTISSLPAVSKIITNINCSKKDNFISDNPDKYLFGYLNASKKYEKIIFIDTLKNSIVYSLKLKKINYLKNKKSIILLNSINDTSAQIKEIILNGKHSLFIGKKIINKNKKNIGTIILKISYQPIDKIMFENNIHNGLGKTGEVYLVGNDFLMRSSSRFIKNSRFKTKVKTLAAINAFKNKQGNSFIKDYRNIPVFSSYNKLDIKNLNWAIIAEIDKKEAMQPINQVENNIIYMSILISLLLLGIIATFSSNLTSPIKKLQIETEKIFKGEYGQTIDLKCNNEVGDLIKYFNKMSLKLKEQAEKLEYEQIIRSSYTIDGQEIERQRLSRELHDGIGQYLLAIKMKLEQFSGFSDPNQASIINQTKNLLRDTINEIRNISNDLMPSVLSEYGLINALENLSNNINQNSNLSFTLKTNINKTKLNKKAQIYIYRIIQEALNNTLKHSKASDFSVFINENKNIFNLKIKDNGIGTNRLKNQKINGNGLINIKERVNLLSGNVIFLSEPNKGFIIQISIPI